MPVRGGIVVGIPEFVDMCAHTRFSFPGRNAAGKRVLTRAQPSWAGGAVLVGAER